MGAVGSAWTLFRDLPFHSQRHNGRAVLSRESVLGNTSAHWVLCTQREETHTLKCTSWGARMWVFIWPHLACRSSVKNGCLLSLRNVFSIRDAEGGWVKFWQTPAVKGHVTWHHTFQNAPHTSPYPFEFESPMHFSPFIWCFSALNFPLSRLGWVWTFIQSFTSQS